MSIGLKSNPLDKRLYFIWNKMHYRCENPKHKHYKHYGGRGIAVCEEWNSFIKFAIWALNNGYQDNLTLDRIDNNKGYSPSNCKWSTLKEQANNKQRSIVVRVNGHAKSFNVRQRNKKWEFRIEVDDNSGKRKQISKCGFNSKEEAMEAARQTIITGVICPPKKAS